MDWHRWRRLNRFADGRFEAFTSKDGLGSDVISSIHPGRDGVLWIGTDGGELSRVTKNGRIATYTSRAGLPDDSIFQILEDRHGYLWMSSNPRALPGGAPAVERFGGGAAGQLSKQRVMA